MKSSAFALLFLVGCTAQQADLKPTAPEARDELDVSPGLKPDEVQQAIEAVKPRLADCRRLDLPDEADVTADDRVLLEFTYEPADKKLPIHVTRARSVFLDPECLADWAELITLPPLKYLAKAEISWRSRFRTTSEERAAERQQIAKDLKSFCDEFQRRLAHALKDGAQSEPDLVVDSAALVLNSPNVSFGARNVLGTIVMVGPQDQHSVYASAAEQVSAPACDGLRDYATRLHLLDAPGDAGESHLP